MNLMYYIIQYIYNYGLFKDTLYFPGMLGVRENLACGPAAALGPVQRPGPVYCRDVRIIIIRSRPTAPHWHPSRKPATQVT